MRALAVECQGHVADRGRLDFYPSTARALDKGIWAMTSNEMQGAVQLHNNAIRGARYAWDEAAENTLCWETKGQVQPSCSQRQWHAEKQRYRPSDVAPTPASTSVASTSPALLRIAPQPMTASTPAPAALFPQTGPLWSPRRAGTSTADDAEPCYAIRAPHASY